MATWINLLSLDGSPSCFLIVYNMSARRDIPAKKKGNENHQSLSNHPVYLI